MYPYPQAAQSYITCSVMLQVYNSYQVAKYLLVHLLYEKSHHTSWWNKINNVLVRPVVPGDKRLLFQMTV